MIGEFHVGKIVLAVDLDQSEIGLRIGADHLGGVDCAVVGRHLHRVGVIDHVIVGHGIAVRRDEEAGAFADDGLIARRLAARRVLAELVAELIAELLEEFVKRRAGLRRNLLLVVIAHLLRQRRFGGGGNLDAHRDHRRFHFGDEIGKALRMRQRLLHRGSRIGCACALGVPNDVAQIASSDRPAAKRRRLRRRKLTARCGGQ